MPRDLGLEEKPASILESPDSTEDSDQPEGGNFVLLRNNQDQAAGEDSFQEPFNLHPYTRPLTISDLESCVALEEAAFVQEERCSREKVSLNDIFALKRLSVESHFSLATLSRSSI